ncbi:MAG: sigma-70 family RNA polymerase sigma factor [Bacteroidales bacterium]|nr:sigma-70 family RNA polymerase sigma factor [Bacteroidales bacterium]MBN2697864.1 sigma-70 family RNA polymerase sigma factor [Bacteroidales bacterium]
MNCYTQNDFTGHLLFMQDQLFYYALQLTENQHDARDLVQETSYKALRHRNKLLNEENIRAWLYTILRNSYINLLRSSHNRKTIIEGNLPDPVIINTLAGKEYSPDELLMRKELHEIIGLLPETYGEPLKMFLSGYSYKEISEKINIPIGTVKSRIHLGKKKIRKVYLA